MTRIHALVAAVLLAAATATSAEPAVTVRAVELKATPHADAKSVAPIAADTKVDVIARQGAWVQLKSGRTTGWAKLFDIRAEMAAGAPTKKGGSGVADTLGLAMGTRGSSVTTGVRGLDADMLEKASPNAAEYATLVTYARSKEQASAFAKTGKLATREVAEIGGAKTAQGGSQ
ncbi:MAG TPA: SH3 domain-containing protein [Casimicrobiaceae bacterium]|nr:SH3 domain-containing protein [Casimicrobiaceae bacterium]